MSPHILALLLLAWQHLPIRTGQVSVAPVVDLADLSLNDRCAIAAILSRQMLHAADFNAVCADQDGANVARRLGKKFNLFISRYTERHVGLPMSVLRKDETCGEVGIYSMYAPGPSIAMNLGAGGRDDLPDDETYQLVWSRTLGAGRWEFVWRYNKRIWSCPKPVKGVPRVCVDSLPAVVALPELRVVIVKRLDGGFDVESSVLELIRRDEVRPYDAAGASPQAPPP